MGILDQYAVGLFAQGGIALGAIQKRDFAWGHDAYGCEGPSRKDIEVRIYIENYMGKVVHRETVKDVHYEDAAKVAQGILDQYKEQVSQNSENEEVNDSSNFKNIERQKF